MRIRHRQIIEEGSSFMYDHHMEVHGNDEHNSDTDYTFHLVETFQDPMTRQLNEAARIQLAMRGLHSSINGRLYPIMNLNRKIEYFTARKRTFEKEP